MLWSEKHSSLLGTFMSYKMTYLKLVVLDFRSSVEGSVILESVLELFSLLLTKTLNKLGRLSLACRSSVAQML